MLYLSIAISVSVLYFVHSSGLATYAESIFQYEGDPKSFCPRHVKQQYFPQSIHQCTSFTDSYDSAADMM